MSVAGSCHLLQLPAELRTQIFSYLFHNAQIRFDHLPRSSGSIQWIAVKHNTNVSVLATCKSLRREASPMFWDVFELFIPTRMIYELRDIGIWSSKALSRIISVRSQVRNVSLGFNQTFCYIGQAVEFSAVTSSFVSGLKDYSNLRRLTIAHVCDGMWQDTATVALGMEEMYDALTYRERRELWVTTRPGRFVGNCKASEFPFDWRDHKDHTFSSRQNPSWFLDWMQVYILIMNWRRSPDKSDILGHRSTSSHSGETGNHRSTSMNFRVFHRHYKHMMYTKKPTDSEEAPYPLEGALPPRVHEIEILEKDSTPILDIRSMRLVGEHRAFWEQVSPPATLVDVGNSMSFLNSYPFWHGDETSTSD